MLYKSIQNLDIYNEDFVLGHMERDLDLWPYTLELGGATTTSTRNTDSARWSNSA